MCFHLLFQFEGVLKAKVKVPLPSLQSTTQPLTTHTHHSTEQSRLHDNIHLKRYSGRHLLLQWFFLEIYFRGGGGGQTNILRNRGGHRLQLKCIKFKLAKAQGGQDHFQGAKCPPPPPPPPPPLKPPKYCTMYSTSSSSAVNSDLIGQEVWFERRVTFTSHLPRQH